MGSTPFRRLLHWGPITVLCIIKLITWAMVHLIGMWWPPHVSLFAAVHSALFLGLAASTLYYFLQSLLEGPGYVPLGWKPQNEEDIQYLQYCEVCKGYKAPRSHHCRKCGRCIKKMDHHCPWINCCVGYANHGYFTMFLISAVLGCFQATIVLSVCMWYGINRAWYTYHGTGREPLIYLTMTTLPLVLLAIGMALGVVLAVGALLYFQIKGIIRNQTTIEDWIIEKAVSRREEHGLPPFQFPYDLGRWRNVKLALFGAPGDGLWWPLRDGCGKYDLTLEQIRQKCDKRVRARTYEATGSYSGRVCPLRAWPRAALAAPCTDEPRLPLAPGDRVSVTRHRKHWLFGSLVWRAGQGVGQAVGQGVGQEMGQGVAVKGWFPRACATLLPHSKPD